MATQTEILNQMMRRMVEGWTEKEAFTEAAVIYDKYTKEATEEIYDYLKNR